MKLTNYSYTLEDINRYFDNYINISKSVDDWIQQTDRRLIEFSWIKKITDENYVRDKKVIEAIKELLKETKGKELEILELKVLHNKKVTEIENEVNYSKRQIYRILKKQKIKLFKKINKK